MKSLLAASDFDLALRYLSSNCKLYHYISYPHSKFGVQREKVLCEKQISFSSNRHLDLAHRHLNSKPKLDFDISFPQTKSGMNQPKSGKWFSIFSNSDLDLDHRHLGSNSKLPLDVSYPHTKSAIIGQKKTQVNERNPKTDFRPHTNLS